MVFYYVRAKIPCIILFKMGAVRAFQCGLHICSRASMSIIVLNWKEELVVAKREEGYELKTVHCTILPYSHLWPSNRDQELVLSQGIQWFFFRTSVFPTLTQVLCFFSENIVGKNYFINSFQRSRCRWFILFCKTIFLNGEFSQLGREHSCCFCLFVSLFCFAF